MAVDYQLALEHAQDLPSAARVQAIVDTVLGAIGAPPANLVVRVVDAPEMAELNLRFRNRDRNTNVLSFPFESPREVEEDYAGDVIVCYPVARAESADRKIDFTSHFAHLVVHGVLHLFGYDHQRDDEAEEMEDLERRILGRI